ncbi:acrylyl-CoA reductase family protein [Paenibacillus massiliensis]|uniref:acrylyl-CoA reductase family protein n=1 Tax=Paenibacillus massiliensis TaxID=225917 RepID=UPI0003FB6946|nr:acryloyl-CoA reductase [Paenibacillus massiliensis]
MTASFRALVVDQTGADAEVTAHVGTLTQDQLPPGDILIRVSYSSVNYKDGLASKANGGIVKSYPFVPGIDCSGTVVSSTDDHFREGQAVLATGYGLGVSQYGGFSEYVRVPKEWVVPLPEGLSLRDAMIFGTAGFTAALSIHKLEQHGMRPEAGPVLVTGATGGVGSTAVAMLAHRGYEVSASTGKSSSHSYLQSLGAQHLLTREEVYEGGKIKALDKQLWQAAVDPVGGHALAAVLSKITYGGAVAVSGLTGGTAVPTSVHPFILRGISLLGIDSVFCPTELRRLLWNRMATDLMPPQTELLVEQEIALDELPQALSKILQGQATGRTLVRL